MRRRASILVLLALVATACPRVAPMPAPAERVSARTLLAGLEARRASVVSIRAQAKLRSGMAGMWVREAVLVARPTFVRMDVLSPFGLALALGTDGSTLWVFPAGDGVRYEGPASPANLARFLGAPVAVEDLVEILLGLPPRRTPIDSARVAWDGGGRWRVVVPHAEGTQDLLFDAGTFDVTEASERRGGTTVVRLRFDDYRDRFPHRIDVEVPGSGVEASLRYVAVDRNQSLDTTVFAPPAAVPSLPLDVVPIAH